MISTSKVVMATMALSGCVAVAGDDGDPALEVGTSLVDGSPDALRALRVANSASVSVLRDGAKLTASAAKNLVARRDGADQLPHTADDRPFYTLAELDAVRDIGPAMIGRLATYGQAQPDTLGVGLRVDALPPELADPDHAGLITAIAADPSLQLDGDPLTLLPAEWERALLFAHHFTPSTAERVAQLRPYLFASDFRRGPFLDLATIDRPLFGEGEPSWALDAVLQRTAGDPGHTIGRLYGDELAAALADPGFAAQHPGLAVVQAEYVSIWNAHVTVTDPGDLPLPLAATRELLRSRGVATFAAAYPVDRAAPPAVAALTVPLPFSPGTEIVCMQGNNSMAAGSSHAPDQLRYALDLDAPLLTPVTASLAGTAYVYDHARVDSFDNYGFGNILLIDLHNGFALLHAHLATFAVSNGQAVTAGQLVGTVGNTGAAGGAPHVHFQVVALLRTPDPAHEEYHSDTPIPADTPFGSPEPFTMRAQDLTAGDPAAHAIASRDFACGESAYLRGAAHVYR